MNSLYIVGRINILYLFLLFSPTLLLAQPANDDCDNAIFLDNLDGFCSDTEAFTNRNATHDEEMPISACVEENNQDVWFRFVALEPNITITIIGETGGNLAGGSLRNPAVQLFFAEDGDCKSELDFVECAADEPGIGSATINRGGLISGTEYLIKVQGTFNRSGTFQLCINNYTPPFPPAADCADANLLCSKETFFLEKTEGAGDDPDEAAGTCLGTCDIFSNSESSSVWYKWIAATSGTLTFTLTPENPEDDLDFALYELPDGLDDCNDKRLLRCMASGEILQRPFSVWEPCTAATGLREGDDDEEETCGCDSGDNNFAEAITMEEGKTYALLINNFSESDNGFTISFGGTGEFLGPAPKAEFVANDGDFCAGTEITFSGASSSFVLGEITDYRWSFGQGATPASDTGVGPHRIFYETPGEKNVVLTVETDLGCLASDIEEAIVVIESCCEDKNRITGDGIVKEAICGENQGAIDLTVESISQIDEIEWNTNDKMEDISNLSSGNYTVTVTNLAACEETFAFTVDSVPPFEVVPNLTAPTCGGGTDGEIELNIQDGAEPILFDFGEGASQNNSFDSLSAGNYPFTITDVNGCSEIDTINLSELTLALDTAAINIVPPTCTGFKNGRIAVTIANGRPEYLYNWNDEGFESNSSYNNIAAGTYQLEVMDDDLCEGSFSFVVESPEALSLILDSTNISCSGAGDGMITAILEGGTGTYSYSWNNGATTEQITNLSSGTYAVNAKDENDCEISRVTNITEPSSIGVQVTNIQNLTCFGDDSGIISVQGTGGNGIYEFSTNGVDFRPGPDLGGLGAGDYTVTIRDPQGCTEETTASIIQPDQLSVDAGEDITIDLGYTTDLQAITTPFTRPVDFIWSNPDFLDCMNCPDPTAQPPVTTPFVITITDETNCKANDTVMVFVNTNRPLFIPNVFSPNNDGNNDRFTLFGGPATTRISTLQIFDRWGNMIYNSTNLPANDERFGWDGIFDGKEMNPGVYVFMAKVLFFDNVEETVSGEITLVR